MIEIEMSRDIREFEPKIIGPLSIRQLITIGIAVIVAVPIIKFAPIEITYRVLLAMFIAGPIGVCGFIKMYGDYLDVFLLKILVPFYMRPPKRPYKTENTFEIEYMKAITPQDETTKKKNKKKKIKYTKANRPLN